MDHINNMSGACKKFIGIQAEFTTLNHPFIEWLMQYADLDPQQAMLIINGAEQPFRHPPLPQP
eukprot:11037385-Karenia_brevis.AAC.1